MYERRNERVDTDARRELMEDREEWMVMAKICL